MSCRQWKPGDAITRRTHAWCVRVWEKVVQPLTETEVTRGVRGLRPLLGFGVGGHLVEDLRFWGTN